MHPPGLDLCLGLGSDVPRDDCSLSLTRFVLQLDRALFSCAILSLLLIRFLLLGCGFQERPPSAYLCSLANWSLRKEMCMVDMRVPRFDLL